MQNELLQKLMELKDRAFKGKMKRMGGQAQHLDPHTAYVWTGEGPMPSRMLLNRYRAMCLYASFRLRKLPLGAMWTEGAVRFHESHMSGYNAVPDAVAAEGGDYDLLVYPQGRGEYGGLGDLGDIGSEDSEG